MTALRRTLYLQAAVWALGGLALALAPRSVLVSLSGRTPGVETAWLRLLGIHAFALALLMVLVGHRAEDLWWWSWAFCLATVASAAAAVLNAAFGMEPGESSAPWWILSGVAVAFSSALLYGLYLTSRERPPG